MPVLPELEPTPPAPGDTICQSWATSADVCGPCTAETSDLDTWMSVASDLLYELSGQRYPGLCEDVARPCVQCPAGDGPRFYGGTTELWSSASTAMFGSCGCGGDRCGCTTLSELWLTGWPLVSVEQVTIDGVVLDSSAYEINDWSRLVRVDGESWPACSDDFVIEFTYGVAPPAAGAAAAASLGCQLALACSGGDGCRLPQRVQSITRQGVSMVLLDPFTFFDDGRTGLYDVDLFLAAYGPTSKKRWGGLVVNPDVSRRVRRVTS